MITIEDAGPPLTEERIASFERDLEVRLPDQYRKFLLRTNGGMPSPDTVDIGGFSQSPTDVQVFYRIGGSVKSSELNWNRSTLTERLPDDLLPIACDSGGSAFCISLRREGWGAVLYCDLESVAFNYGVKPKFYPVAPDFDSFLAKIRPYVKITLTGSRSSDANAANTAAGLKRTPDGYTWHHHQDGTTMQLIPKEIHAQTAHTGGSSLTRTR